VTANPNSLLDRYYRELSEMGGDFEDDIYTLYTYFLIETSIDTTEFEMHRLVQSLTRIWLELRGEVDK
jgi:hypothetical protein